MVEYKEIATYIVILIIVLIAAQHLNVVVSGSMEPAFYRGDIVLVENADYEGFYELPKIKTSDKIPEKLIPFSRAMSRNQKDFDCWVVFYEHDVKFERLWNNPRKYLNKLKKFKGVISPDFSIYRDMPLVMQMWNTYRGRAIAVWLQNNGIEVIPNVRFSDERSYSFVFDGIESEKTVSVSTYGCISHRRA